MANAAALGVLILGVMWTSQIRDGLIEARAGILHSEAVLLRNVLQATVDPELQALNPDEVANFMREMRLPPDARVRVFDALGEPMTRADTNALATEIHSEPLPPVASRRGLLQRARDAVSSGEPRIDPQEQLHDEVMEVLADERPVGEDELRYTLREDADGELVISVALPVRIVQQIAGVVVAETLDFDDVLAREREAKLPFIIVAVAVTLISSIALTAFIARPVRILARAAERVRELGPRRARIPDLSKRNDEIGDLSVTLAQMTEALSARIETIERFAADVSHELKNPLTSIRSALETLPVATDEEKRERLIAVVQHDVRRIDRLITDISNASRLDAEIARAAARQLDLRAAVSDIVALYHVVDGDDAPAVVFEDDTDDAPLMVSVIDGPFGQVLRNLIDNARSFSPAGGSVRVRLEGRYDDQGKPCAAVVVDDDGPGVPPENVERIFARFYTDRSGRASFGDHSGLGLAIVRQIVEAAGGRVWAENRERPDGSGEIAGARFVVCLPLQWR